MIEPGPFSCVVGILCNSSDYESRISDSYIEYKSNEVSVGMSDRIFKLDCYLTDLIKFGTGRPTLMSGLYQSSAARTVREG